VKKITQTGGKAVALKLDVGDIGAFPAFRDAVAAKLQSIFGRGDFDYLVNNAGYGLFNPIATVTEEQFDGLFNVHLKGPFFLTQILLPLMADGGQIINITSATTRVATSGCRSLCRLQGWPRSPDPLHGQGVRRAPDRANSIAPGAIRTELGGGLNDEFEAMLAGQTALGRVGEPEEIGGVVASLCLPTKPLDQRPEHRSRGRLHHLNERRATCSTTSSFPSATSTARSPSTRKALAPLGIVHAHDYDGRMALPVILT
jgi:NAD(P)-dependent dehydrogenase (short-subunit alcohol dehydrogenase family)